LNGQECCRVPSNIGGIHAAEGLTSRARTCSARNKPRDEPANRGHGNYAKAASALHPLRTQFAPQFARWSLGASELSAPSCSAILFDPDANVDICITFKAVLVGFLEEDYSGSALLLPFSFLTV
jgi:hypothetical protein